MLRCESPSLQKLELQFADAIPMVAIASDEVAMAKSPDAGRIIAGVGAQACVGIGREIGVAYVHGSIGKLTDSEIGYEPRANFFCRVIALQ